MRDQRARLALERPDMRHDFTWLRRAALGLHAAEADYPESMVDEAFEVFFAARNEVRLHEDVVPALESLAARGLRLFVITNGNADLERIGIARFFERVVHARLAGALKPDPAIFGQLLGGTGLRPGTVAHVGDDPHADVAGARTAGMRSVWLNRAGAAWPSDPPGPDHEVRSLVELSSLPGFS
jgi:putative hydrolase of the HAD superfamily